MTFESSSLCQPVNMIPLGLTGSKGPNINLVREQCGYNTKVHMVIILCVCVISFLMKLLQAYSLIPLTKDFCSYLK